MFSAGRWRVIDDDDVGCCARVSIWFEPAPLVIDQSDHTEAEKYLLRELASAYSGECAGVHL